MARSELARCKCDDRVEVGVDEVGRGSLAGPVFAAAVVWNPEEEHELLYQIRDSKKLSAGRRQLLSDYIKDVAVDFSIVSVPADVIDRVNILQATMSAMHGALDGLLLRFDHILVDGDRFRAYMPAASADAFVPHECVVSGDNTYVSVAAASILAKVARDAYMSGLHEAHPLYGWNENKGYGTSAHCAAILEHGLTPHHRRTFVRKLLASSRESRDSLGDSLGDSVDSSGDAHHD